MKDIKKRKPLDATVKQSTENNSVQTVNPDSADPKAVLENKEYERVVDFMNNQENEQFDDYNPWS